MSKGTKQHREMFPRSTGRPIETRFDDPMGSSDGGAMLLLAAETKMDLITNLAACIPDVREPGKVRHTIEKIIRQRVFGIATGYEDANDAARLKRDPMHAILLGRDPCDRYALSSQPTICRLENSMNTEIMEKMRLTLLTRVLLANQFRHGKSLRHMTLDIDWTDDRTYGSQDGAMFNSYYGGYCYRPLVAHVSFGDDPEKYLVDAKLMEGTGSMIKPTIEMIRWIVAMLKAFFPDARILVRLDSGFQHDDMFTELENLGLDYVAGVAGNTCLAGLSEPYVKKARARSNLTGRSARFYAEAHYGAQSWSRKRRIVIKAEVVVAEGKLPLDNARYVVTNLRQSPRTIYRKTYCARGDAENRIKEIKNDLALGRTSCRSFVANQLRVIFASAAYVLMQEIRHAARATRLAKAQVQNIRLHLLKIGVRVVETTRTICLHLPEMHPYRDEWRIIARRLGAVLT
jgi:hypothetical protein